MLAAADAENDKGMGNYAVVYSLRFIFQVHFYNNRNMFSSRLNNATRRSLMLRCELNFDLLRCIDLDSDVSCVLCVLYCVLVAYQS